ncbi:MAG: family 16 glycosylhydrolase [Candidatus Margulisiibacteriota bacterium]
MSGMDVLTTIFFGGKIGEGLTVCSRNKDKQTATNGKTSTTTKALITCQPELVQEMDAHDSKNWQKANWSNGNPFDCTWQPDNVTFQGGIMKLTLDNKGCPQKCDGKPYASGEYRTTKEKYSYGLYEARIKATKGKGLVAGSFFTYTGTWGKSDHHEIDFEFLGKDCSIIQLNYYAEGKGNHEKIVNLDFNACKEFHNYGIKWAPKELVWYVDGKPVHRATGTLPSKPSKIMVNFWPGTPEVTGWLGSFKYSGPLHVECDWIKYAPLNCATKTEEVKETPKPKEAKQPVSSKASVKPLSISAIQQGDFNFNGGNLTRNGDVYSFSASRSKDPGAGIFLGNRDVSSYKTLKFEVTGSLKKHGGYARFIVQVYDEKDNDYTPSVSLDPVSLTGKFSTATVNLEGQITKAKKVQVLLVTDNGSCKVKIKNMRFE